jgi:hypothetical protein
MAAAIINDKRNAVSFLIFITQSSLNHLGDAQLNDNRRHPRLDRIVLLFLLGLF